MILNDLAVGYGKKRILSGVNATLPVGKMTCLLGPNGAGKSTLLRTIARFLQPIEGTISLADQGIPVPKIRKSEESNNLETENPEPCPLDLSSLSPLSIAKTIGVVLTDRIESAHITVWQLVESGRQPYTGFWGRCSAEDCLIVADAIKLMGLVRLQHRKVSSLSDGERQKAFIAKAIAQQTPYILLDEPTAFLDYPGKVELLKMLLRLCHEQGKTVLMSTHDIDLALQMADNLWLIAPKTKGNADNIDKVADVDNIGSSFHSGTVEEMAAAGYLDNYAGTKIERDAKTNVFRIAPVTV